MSEFPAGNIKLFASLKRRYGGGGALKSGLPKPVTLVSFFSRLHNSEKKC